MNSEELELSLRTEFESYLKGFLVDLRHEVSEFQKSFEAEFEKHKAQTDEGFRRLAERFEAGVRLDHAFNDSVLEHLRLARDEGATITAVAIGEAEKLKEAAAPAAEFDRLRDGINEISSKTSQAEILKSLVEHASNFAPRGAFFIVKNEHLVGWRAFGENAVDESAVRGVQFAVSADTLLAEAITRLGIAAAGADSHRDDVLYLDALKFGRPDRMYAVPLVARGRGVAVLYADYGSEGASMNPEALETLVRVAGLTVELAAAAVQPVAVPQQTEPSAIKDAPEAAYRPPEPVAEETSASEVESASDEYRGVQEFDNADVQAPSYEIAAKPVESIDEFQAPEAVAEPAYEPSAGSAPDAVAFERVEETPVEEYVAGPVEAVEAQVSVERFEAVAEQVEEVTYFEPVVEESAVSEATFVEAEPVEGYIPVEAIEEFPEVIEEAEPEPAVEYVPHAEQPVEVVNGSAASVAMESPVEVAAAGASRTKYRDRNMDLPIEVPEEERRLHNDARRFARLLVSEIKLYNEQKVAEGREMGDLYERLREAIDRSRDMYDKRVQQPVADKFDYFHYELVTSLADGDDVKLGAAYPGSKVPA